MEHALEASAHLAAHLCHVRAALTRDVGLLVGASTTPDRLGGERFESSLGVEVGSATQVQQAIVGSVGPMVRADDSVVVPVRWQPCSHEHVLPAFEGEFELTVEPPGTRVCLHGAYTVPLGPVGRVGDWAAGRRLAQRVLSRHLEAVAVRIDREAREVAASEEEQHAPGSENYIG